MHLNVEIKARCQHPQRMRERLLALGADFRGDDHQIDTYFRVLNGRLKLREGTIEHVLVFYDRPDQEGPKDSRVVLYHPEGPSLKEALMAACGPLVVVDKIRSIYFMGNVKFHVDEVRDLGSFCEIEAIDADGTRTREILLEQCTRYMKECGISQDDLISCSYSDLLLQRKR
ncbi:CYTH domain-containing protein [Candidatus Woesearchaeota archaeon]|nr:CYTH domain-containing protein [Candidatus Woesearchaeota archaeon]